MHLQINCTLSSGLRCSHVLGAKTTDTYYSVCNNVIYAPNIYEQHRETQAKQNYETIRFTTSKMMHEI